MMQLRLFATWVILLVLPTIAKAEIWTSPDGFLSVTPPDATKFQSQPPPPPFLVLWVSNDKSMRLGVIKVQIPSSAKLIQSSAEEGFAQVIGGKVTRLPTKQVSGYEIWNMTARNPSVEVTQAIIRHDGAIYKLMAATVGDSADTTSINRFIDSLSIMQPANQAEAQPVERPSEGLDLHNLSKMVGSTSVLLLIGLLIYLAARGRKNHQT